MKTLTKLKVCGLLLIIATGCITVQPCVCPQVEKIQQPFYQPQFYQPQFENPFLHYQPYKGIYLGEGDTTITWPQFKSQFKSFDTIRLTRPIMLPIPQSEIIKLL